MALSSWTFDTNAPSVVQYDIHQDSVITGNGSLEVVIASGTGHRTFTGVEDATAVPLRGRLYGRSRSIFRVRSFTTGFECGLTMMHSQEDVTSTSGSCYAVIMKGDGVSTFRVQVLKFTSGLASNPTVIAETAASQSSLGTPFALDVIWQKQASQVIFQIQFDDNTTGYGGLTPLLTTQDTSSILTTSTCEGIMVRATSTGPDLLSVDLDNTDIYRIL